MVTVRLYLDGNILILLALLIHGAWIIDLKKKLKKGKHMLKI